LFEVKEINTNVGMKRSLVNEVFMYADILICNTYTLAVLRILIFCAVNYSKLSAHMYVMRSM